MEPWSEYELNNLKSLPSIIDKNYLIKLFPKRSLKSIISKKKKLKIKCRIKRKHHNEWTKEEILLLKENFYKPKKELEKLLPNRKYTSILQKANLLKLIRKNKPWTPEEIIFLKENYKNEDKKFILNTLNRSWDAIVLKAHNLYKKSSNKKFKRSYKFFRKSNLECLLKETNDIMYIIGFILADGHIDIKNSRLSITVSEKDKDHLIKISGVLNTKVINYEHKSVLSCQNKDIIPEVVQKYEISNTKTYNPPIFNNYNLTDDQWISLICGFIDGDGCIKFQSGRKSNIITIKCHSSWIENLKFIENKIYNIILKESSNKLTKINNSGYATLNFTKMLLITKLKEKALTLNIPLLLRKWDKIDLNYVLRYEKAKNIKEQSIILYKNGLTIKEISIELGYSYAGIYKIIRHYFKCQIESP